ncbi:MAG: hypothetical protein MJK04_06095, partial [Psychrosphaera sp.]|nr:hypothetical protein [Psychrosphaera sp.]
CCIGAILYFVGFKGQRQWATLSLANIAEHLNRHFSKLEESCGLLLRPQTNDNVLQRLQRQ